MSQQTPTTARLTELSRQMDGALASARSGALIVLTLSVIGVGLTGHWLGKAKAQLLTDLSPEFVSDQAVARVTESLPALTPQLKGRVIEAAPQLLDAAEHRLGQIPDQFANKLMTSTTTELDKLTPQVESELLASLRAALAAARDQRRPGETDEQHIKSILTALGDTYETQSIQLIDNLRARYTKSGGDILGYLDFLANNKGLDHRQTLQRQSLVTFLTIASRAKTAGQP